MQTAHMQETSKEHSKNVHVLLSSGVRAQSLPFKLM